MNVRAGSRRDENRAPVRLGLLGGFRLSVDSEVLTLPMNSQQLVSFLALQTRPLLRTYVSGSLWSDATDQHTRGSLRSALTRLRHPRYSLVELTSDHIELSPSVSVDVREGEALARRVLDPTQDLDDLSELNDEMLSADLLPDWTENWVLLEREAYHQLRLRALESLCRRLTQKELRTGRPGRHARRRGRAVAGKPAPGVDRGSPRRGQRDAALREYEDFRRYLFDELGREPSAEMQALVEGLKRN